MFYRGFYPVHDFMRVQIINTNPNHRKKEFSDVSLVEKFEITDEEYAKKSDTVRAFMIRNKRGKYSDSAIAEALVDHSDDYKEEAEKIKVGDRFTTTGKISDDTRGVVMFVGKTKFKEGYWVGVKFDEPYGKNDGR